MVCLGADQFAENHLENSGADVKRSRLEGRSGILTWKWILEYPNQLWNHVETRECRQQQPRWKFLQYLHLHLRQQDQSILVRNRQNSWLPCMRDSRSGEVTHTRECRSYQDAWEDSRRTASAEEVRRGIVGDPDTGPLDSCGSSTDPEPQREKRPLRQTTRTRLTRWMRTTSEEDQRHLNNWNQWTMKTCRKRHEWQETFFQFVERTVSNLMSTRKLGRTQTWRFERHMKAP